MTGYWSQPRPYIDGQRFTGGEHYWRPDLGVQRWFWLPPAVKTAVLYSTAATLTCALAGLRIWQAVTAADDEIGD